MLGTQRLGLPTWMWLSALAPWIWIIPTGQLFWDDWVIFSRVGFQQQIELWDTGAKHPLNPVIYSMLLPVGAWSFHFLIALSTVAGALAIRVTLSGRASVSPQAAQVSPAIYLALPVFQARFSLATLEYSLSLAALLVSWAILRRRRGALSEVVSLVLLVYAIGVPSMAILFPLLWCDIVIASSTTRTPRGLLRSAVRFCYIPLVPACFALAFSTVIDSGDKYQPSVGAIVEFFRGATVLGLLVSGFVIYSRRRSPQLLSRWGWTIAGAMATYGAFFPYFAVGYNPLSDFLPWRFRENVISAMPDRVMIVLLLTGLMVILGFARRTESKQTSFHARGLLWLTPVILFGSTLFVLGPMDWESRHWLVAWPFMTATIVTFISVAKRDEQMRLVRFTFLLLLLPTILISSEYIVDTLKQRSMMDSIAVELPVDLVVKGNDDSLLHVVLALDSDVNRLNARHRGYRSYEWAGIISAGTGIPFDRIEIHTLSSINAPEADELKCEGDSAGIIASPVTNSSFLSSLMTLSVETKWNIEPLSGC